MILLCGLSEGSIGNIITALSVIVVVVIYYIQRYNEAKDAHRFFIESLNIHLGDLDRFISSLKELVNDMNSENFEYIDFPSITNFNNKITSRINILALTRFYNYCNTRKELGQLAIRIIYYLDQIENVKELQEKANHQNTLIREERNIIHINLHNLMNLKRDSQTFCDNLTCNEKLLNIRRHFEENKLFIVDGLTSEFKKLGSINKYLNDHVSYSLLCENHQEFYSKIIVHQKQNENWINNFKKILVQESGVIDRYEIYKTFLEEFLEKNKQLEESEF